MRVSALEGRVASIDNDVGNQEVVLNGQRQTIEVRSGKCPGKAKFSRDCLLLVAIMSNSNLMASIGKKATLNGQRQTIEVRSENVSLQEDK